MTFPTLRLNRTLLARRRQILTLLVAIAAIGFPLLHDNDADIDSAANAAAWACHSNPTAAWVGRA